MAWFVCWLMLYTPASLPEFEVQLISGKTLSGKIVSWDQGVLVVSTSDKDTLELPDDQVMEVSQASQSDDESESSDFDHQPQVPSSAPITVTLKDGTQLRCSTIVTVDNRLQLTWHDRAVNVPTQVTRSVRFQRPSEALDLQWNEVARADQPGDMLIVRRSATSLDSIAGVVRAVTPTHVAFEFEGEQMDVQREKLEGILYFVSTKEKLPEPRMTVRTNEDDQIYGSSASVRDGVWKIRSSVDVSFELFAREIRSVSLRSQHARYLSDIEPMETTITPWIRATNDSNALIKLLYAPRKDRGFSGPLTLRTGNNGPEKVFEKGLAIHSQTQITYRLAEEFLRFKGIVGLDPQTEMSGAAHLQIIVDDQTVVDQVVLRSADPVELDVDVEGARRLKIVVDYGPGGDFGDRVHLCDARLIK